MRCGRREVVPQSDVRDEAGLGRLPAEPLLGQLAGRRCVQLGEDRERHPEMSAGLLGGDRLDRYVQVTGRKRLIPADAMQAFLNDRQVAA